MVKNEHCPNFNYSSLLRMKQGRKRPLDTLKRRRERKRKRKRERKKGRRRDIERNVCLL